jgi:hypothetical protein
MSNFIVPDRLQHKRTATCFIAQQYSSCHLRLIAVRSNSVGIATHNGLRGPGIETRWGRDFPSPDGEATSPFSLNIVSTGFFPGGKANRAWLWPPTLSIVKVKERVQLYFYSPSGPSWLVVWLPLPLLLPLHQCDFSHARKNSGRN